MAISWKQFDQQRWQFLRYARREFRRALSKQIAPVIQALQDKGTHDTEGALDLLVRKKPMEDAFVRVYRRVGSHFGRVTFRQYAKSETDTWTQNVINAVLTESYDKIEGITNTSKDKIKRLIGKGVQDGLGINEIARSIRSDVGSMKRSTLIARTEIISASNLGSMEGARATGLPMRKIWLSTLDERTRDGHLSANGKKTETLEGLFVVDGDSFEYPGDSSHGARLDNFINCRCAIGYDPY